MPQRSRVTAPDPDQDSTWIASELAPADSVPAPTHSAASLAAAVHQVMDSVTGRRAPRLATLRQRLQHGERAWRLKELDHALHGLHDAATALDFLAGRGGTVPAGRFRAQGSKLAAAAAHLGSVSLHYVGRHAAEAAVARLVWIDLQLESRAMEKRVQKALQWLAEMESDLEARRAATTAEISRRALQELARRGHALENRLHRAQALCGAARAARTLGDQVWAQRGVLCRVLRDEVRGASAALLQRLEPLLDAAGLRPLDPGELIRAIDARHALEVALTHAVAELGQLQALQQELATQLTWMERRGAAID